MINKKETFTASGKLKLFFQSWLPGNKIWGVVVIVHGGGDHSGRFENVVTALVPGGFGVYIFDLRGHGRSPGKRGHINAWDEYRHDLSIFLELVSRRHPEIPLFLFGHSMGGVIVLDFCIRRPPEVNGVMCTSPAIGELGIPRLLFFLAKILDRVWPSLVLPNGLHVPHLSRDKEFVRKTKADPLYHTRSTPRLGMELLKTVEFIHENAAEFNLPLFLIHGDDDRIASVEGSRKFIRHMKHSGVSHKEYKGGYHELFNDLDKKTVLNDLVAWLIIKSATEKA
jgi:alpha-beta hydrolase superfamily lysophospholipase